MSHIIQSTRANVTVQPVHILQEVEQIKNTAFFTLLVECSHRLTVNNDTAGAVHRMSATLHLLH